MVFSPPLLVHAQAQSPAPGTPNNPNASEESAQTSQSDKQTPQDDARANTKDNAETSPAAQSIAQISDPYVDPPRLIRGPNPKYPKDACNVGHQGTSVLSLVVGIDGHPRDVAVVRPLDPELDDSAIAAVSKWRYQAAERDGEPVEVSVHARVRFRLYNRSYGHIAQLWDRSDSNDPKADLQLSKAYLDGNGVPQDDHLSFEFLKMAADWNLPEAQIFDGRALLSRCRQRARLHQRIHVVRTLQTRRRQERRSDAENACVGNDARADIGGRCTRWLLARRSSEARPPGPKFAFAVKSAETIARPRRRAVKSQSRELTYEVRAQVRV
jgi:TonB family protein